MSLTRRLQMIETSLTPKQAVLLWLEEAQQLGIVDYAEKQFNSPMHEAPRRRLTEMVGKAARESLCKQGMKREFIDRVEREARMEIDFLIVLVKNLQHEMNLECTLNAPYIALLYEKFERLLEHFTELNRFEPESWELWRRVVTVRLIAMWRLKEVSTAISERYFDGRPLLFPEEGSRFDQHIDALDTLAKYHNRLEEELPAFTAIDSVALASSVREQVHRAVAERAARAKFTTLEDFGESEAAWKLIEPYALAALNQLRATR